MLGGGEHTHDVVQCCWYRKKAGSGPGELSRILHRNDHVTRCAAARFFVCVFFFCFGIAMQVIRAVHLHRVTKECRDRILHSR